MFSFSFQVKSYKHSCTHTHTNACTNTLYLYNIYYIYIHTVFQIACICLHMPGYIYLFTTYCFWLLAIVLNKEGSWNVGGQICVLISCYSFLDCWGLNRRSHTSQQGHSCCNFLKYMLIGRIFRSYGSAFLMLEVLSYCSPPQLLLPVSTSSGF